MSLTGIVYSNQFNKDGFEEVGQSCGALTRHAWGHQRITLNVDGLPVVQKVKASVGWFIVWSLTLPLNLICLVVGAVCYALSKSPQASKADVIYRNSPKFLQDLESGVITLDRNKQVIPCQVNQGVEGESGFPHDVEGRVVNAICERLFNGNLDSTGSPPPHRQGTGDGVKVEFLDAGAGVDLDSDLNLNGVD